MKIFINQAFFNDPKTPQNSLNHLASTFVEDRVLGPKSEFRANIEFWALFLDPPKRWFWDLDKRPPKRPFLRPPVFEGWKTWIFFFRRRSYDRSPKTPQNTAIKNWLSLIQRCFGVFLGVFGLFLGFKTPKNEKRVILGVPRNAIKR